MYVCMYVCMLFMSDNKAVATVYEVYSILTLSAFFASGGSANVKKNTPYV